MFLDDFHTVADGWIRITATQASRFAKRMAGDYNPIHDPDARRFCVPGDLLFALVLARHGLSQRMTFHFRGMVGDDVPLAVEERDGGALSVVDATGKAFLDVERSGETTRDPAVIEAFTRRYIAFSGRNFPHFLKPLLEEHGVMFNPQRPLVIYDSMGFALERIDDAALEIAFDGATFECQGKRGEARLAFRMLADGAPVGTGAKKLVVSGLQPYDASVMDAFVETFNRRKSASGASS
ncbi:MULTISPECIES: DUF3581 family protein [Modicisalibacter]|uniref:DUF3581 family protein n=1 Tax=Modicisalibacter TaxID=574347 RepID=UPI00100AFA99|nr:MULTISPECIES: DUF3581 family protein [Halomonadaceae]MBZ9559629.1 DUF3581 domain-containing protein [Modicisalibacter sp. R2A 31.J]MBZ9577081.1 DUF3581 domain-containing protein [Modicisalibacter sp. MOD 31.J]